jgi:DNA-binding NtrC family response regulator
MDDLMKRRFPGNIRELENLIERAAVLCRSEHIRREDLAPEASTDEESSCMDAIDTGPGTNYEATMLEIEKRLIFGALDRAKGNQSAAARELGISERHFRSCIKRLEKNISS